MNSLGSPDLFFGALRVWIRGVLFCIFRCFAIRYVPRCFEKDSSNHEIDDCREPSTIVDDCAAEKEESTQNQQISEILPESSIVVDGVLCGVCHYDHAFEIMVQCAAGHLFCKDCIQKWAEEQSTGLGNTTLKCPSEEECSQNFPLAQIQFVLPNVFEKFQNTIAATTKQASAIFLGGVACGVCCDEYDFESMVQCADGHLFCKDCLQKWAEEQLFGLGKTSLKCISQEGCSQNFPFDQLQLALPPKIFDKFQSAIATEELEKAHLTDLVKCPFCEFVAIFPQGQVFPCANPSCTKQSCILCQREDHSPNCCQEEKQETNDRKRTLVEEAMTAARIRECPKCNTRFFKIEGCNKMTCTKCNTKSCYICRQEVKGYDHFCQEFNCSHTNCNKCVLYSNSEDDIRAMEKAGLEANEKAGGEVQIETLLEKSTTEGPLGVNDNDDSSQYSEDESTVDMSEEDESDSTVEMSEEDSGIATNNWFNEDQSEEDEDDSLYDLEGDQGALQSGDEEEGSDTVEGSSSSECSDSSIGCINAMRTDNDSFGNEHDNSDSSCSLFVNSIGNDRNDFQSDAVEDSYDDEESEGGEEQCNNVEEENESFSEDSDHSSVDNTAQMPGNVSSDEIWSGFSDGDEEDSYISDNF